MSNLTPSEFAQLDIYKRAVYLATGDVVSDAQVDALRQVTAYIPWSLVQQVMRPAALSEASLRDFAAASKRVSRDMRMLAITYHQGRQWRNHPQRRIHR